MDSSSSQTIGISIFNNTGCSACYLVAEVANIVTGTLIISGTTAVNQIPIGTTSFTIEPDFAVTPTNVTLTPALKPFTTYDFSETLTLSGETLSSPTAFYVFSAFSVTSAYPTATGCMTFSGPPALTGPLAVPIPLSTDQGHFALVVQSAIASYFEPIECSVGGPENPSVTDVSVTGSLPTPTATSLDFSRIAITLPTSQTFATITSTFLLNTSQSVISTSSITPSSTPLPSHLTTGAKIGIGISTPLGAIAFMTLSAIVWVQHRRRHSESQAHSRKTPNMRGGWRAYFQNKGELDAEEQRRHEADNTNVLREVDAEEQAMCEAEGTRAQDELDSGERYELEVSEQRHELKGA